MPLLLPNRQYQSTEGNITATSNNCNITALQCLSSIGIYDSGLKSDFFVTDSWFLRFDTHTCLHTRLMALFPGLPRWAGTRKAKPNWILLKQETVSGSGISWAICKSAPCSRQITTPAPHHSVFYRPDALPAAQPTASKH